MYREIYAVALLFFVVCPINSFAQKKGAHEVVDPVASFETIALSIDKFFSSSPVFVYKEQTSEIVNRPVYNMRQFSASALTYDVKKTDSLVSPLVANVKLTLINRTTERPSGGCGDVTLPNRGSVGWSTLDGVMKVRGNRDCLFDNSPAKYENERLEFLFTYVHGRWICKGLLGENGEHTYSLSQERMYFADPSQEAEVLAINSVWKAIRFNNCSAATR